MMRSLFYFTACLLIISCSQSPNLVYSGFSEDTAVIYTATKVQENKVVSEVLRLRDKEGTVKHITVLTHGQPPTYIFVKGETSALFRNKELAEYIKSNKDLSYHTKTITATEVETLFGWIAYFSSSWVIKSAYEISPGKFEITAIEPVIEYLTKISSSDE